MTSSHLPSYLIHSVIKEKQKATQEHLFTVSAPTTHLHCFYKLEDDGSIFGTT